MKELLTELRNKVLYLRNTEELSAKGELILLHKLNALEKQFAICGVSNWVAVKERKPDNCDQVFVKYENGRYGINEWWESDDCWKYEFDNMIVKEWCKPPCY